MTLRSYIREKYIVILRYKNVLMELVGAFVVNIHTVFRMRVCSGSLLFVVKPTAK
jgi:hypothetical protein